MPDTIHATCPSCSGVNRIRTDRIASTPVCGRCGTSLLPDLPIELTDMTFDHFITRNDLPVVVDFWSTLCGPCQMMAPAYEQAALDLKGRARLAKLTTDTNQRTASRFGIISVPSLVLFQHGQEAARISGALPANQITNWINQHI